MQTKRSRPFNERVVLEADVSCAVWRIEEIAAYLRLPSVKSAYSIVRQSGFPSPIVHGCRNRRWIATEVKDYFANDKAARITPLRPFEISEPKVVRKKEGLRLA